MKSYNLFNLLTEYHLIVPEIQREYVWGANEQVLTSFLEEINTSLEKQKDVKQEHTPTHNVGFLYSYAVPTNKETLQEIHYIIDGQQRLTTLLLLLYYCSIQSAQHTDFLRLLRIKEPIMSFSYNVRPLTETFLRQLFQHSYIFPASGKDNKYSTSIKNQKWYLRDYDNDMTIQNILYTLDTIHCHKIKEWYAHLTYDSVLHNIYFWYFDVANTTQGEELYITMNSRGEKLTKAEQVKPHLFAKLPNSGSKHYYGKQWDEWEEFFYTKRPKDSSYAIELVDIGLNNFIKIVCELITCQPMNKDKFILPNSLSLRVLDNWFHALKNIAQKEEYKEEITYLYDTQDNKQFYVLKSLLSVSYKEIVRKERTAAREYKRMYKTISNAAKRLYSIEHKPLLNLLYSYRESTENTPFYDFLLRPDINHERVFTEGDMHKISVLQSMNSDEVEEAFWQDEKHKIWDGDIAYLIRWSTEDNTFDFKKYKAYRAVFNTILPTPFKKEQPNLDLVRRALLTQNLTNYPGHYKGYTNICFAYEAKHWKEVIKNDPNRFRYFLDQLRQGIVEHDTEKSLTNMQDIMQHMIDTYFQERKRGKYDDLIRYPELLKYCKQKNIQCWHDTIYLVLHERATKYANIHSYKYYLHIKDLQKKVEDKEYPIFANWEYNFWESDGSCTYFDMKSDDKQRAVDIYWNSGNDHGQIEIHFFLRQEPPEAKNKLKPVANAMRTRDMGIDFEWIKGRYRGFIPQTSNEENDFKRVDTILHNLLPLLADCIAITHST